MTRTGRQSSEGPLPSQVRATIGRWLGPLIIVVVSFISVGLHVSNYTTISPVDELTHIDSLFMAPKAVQDGSKIGEEALREQACRGLAGYPSPACDLPAPLDPTDFQEEGYNTGAVYTPLYYSLTKMVAVPLMFVTGMDSLVTAARLVGALWLAGGLLLTYHVGRRLGAPRAALTSIAVLVAVTPSILFPSSTVSPDATGLVSGAAIAWALLYWEDNPRRHWWAPVLIGALVAALKAVNIVAIFMAACVVLIRLITSWYAERQGASLDGYVAKSDRRPLLLGGVGVAVAAVVVLAGWSMFAASNGIGSTSDAPMNVRTEIASLTSWELLVSFGQFLNPLDGAGNVVSTGTVGFVAQRVAGMLLIAGVFAGALFSVIPPRLRAFGQGVFLAGLLGGPLMTVFIFVLNGAYIAMPGRYAITLIPVAMVMTASFITTRSAQVALGIAASIGWIWTIQTLLA